MSDVERAGVELFADTSDFEQGMDSASSQMAGMGDIAGVANLALDALGAGFDVVSSIIGGAFDLALSGATAGLDFLVSGIQGGIESAIEAEQQINSLNRVINNLGDDAPITSQQALALADNFAALAGGSDDAVLSIIDLGLKSQQISEQEFPGFIQASLDLGAVIGDNTRAAKLLAMAQDDPLAAYKQIERATGSYNTAIEEQIKAMMASGDTAGALELVMGELATTTGGAALQNTQTLAGTIELFTNTIGEAWEEIGTAFLPVLHTLGDVVTTTVLPAITGLASTIGEFITVLLEGNAGSALVALREGLTSVFGPEIAGAVTALFANLVMGAQEIWTAITVELVPALQEMFDKIFTGGPTTGEIFTTAMNAIVDGIRLATGFIVDTLIPAMVGLVDWVTLNWPMIQATITTVFNVINDAINTVVLPFIHDVLIPAFETAVAWVVEHWPEIQAKITEVITAVDELIRSVLAALVVFWAEHGESITTIATAMWTAISETYTQWMTDINTDINNMFTGIKDFWATWGDEITAFFQLMLDGIGEAFDIFALLIETDWTALGTILNVAWESAWTSIQETFNTAISNIQGINWGEIGTHITDGIAQGIRDGAQFIIDAAWEAAVAAFEAAKRALGIQSPSRLFMDIGEMSMVGFAEGIRANADIAQDAIKNALATVDYTAAVSVDAQRVGLPPALGGSGTIYNNNVTQYVNNAGYVPAQDMYATLRQGLNAAMA